MGSLHSLAMPSGKSSVARGFTSVFFFQAEDGIRDKLVTGVQTCALPISPSARSEGASRAPPRNGADSDPRLREHVLPDAGRPADCVLSPLGRLAGRELLLDLDDLAALDLVRVDDRDRLVVVDPAVAGVARR